MSEADEIIRKLNTEQRNYLNRYFAHAPESVTGGTQVTRMPEGTTFIQEVSRQWITGCGKRFMDSVILIPSRLSELWKFWDI